MNEISPRIGPEDSYGRVKRLDFVLDTAASLKPQAILDVGCGTGALLTAPLAEALPGAVVLGIDTDEASIAWARANLTQANLSFLPLRDLQPDQRFDLIIASEVLEHVDQPHQFLVDLCRSLAPGGEIVITIPNGYGPFEFMALAEVLLNLSGLQAVLRRIKYFLRDGKAVKPPPLDTMSTSPHVNFFGFRELSSLFRDCGLDVVRYRARTWFCGYLIDTLLSSPALCRANARAADYLPAMFASDWMFTLRPAGVPSSPKWRRGIWARGRRFLNHRRWRVVPPS